MNTGSIVTTLRYVLAFCATVIVAAYLSSVSMCLVVLSANPVMPSLSTVEGLTRTFITVPIKATLLSAPICALLTTLIMIALLIAQRFELFSSTRQRFWATGTVATLPGIGFGNTAGHSACQLAVLAQSASADCRSELIGSIVLFAVVGMLSGLLLARLTKR